MRKAWEVWTVGDGYDPASFIEAYADKGQAERKIQRLRRSHPYQRYTLRRRKHPEKRIFGTRAHTRARMKSSRSLERKTYGRAPKNQYGLTYARWLAAAGLTYSKAGRHHRAAWHAGEDPSDYRPTRRR